MLRIEKIDWNVSPKITDNGDKLFEFNPLITLAIHAPLYWWIDCDWIKYCFNMPVSDFEFCFDGFECGRFCAEQTARDIAGLKNEPRKLMQLLPLSTYMRGVIQLRYQEIVEVCENYIAGDYKYVNGYGFPDEREWTDFCETLLDIKGVRDIVKEEI